jgi:hypothetical protein
VPLVPLIPPGEDKGQDAAESFSVLSPHLLDHDGFCFPSVFHILAHMF